MKITDPNRTCPECGAAFVAHNGAQRFCTSAHQRAFHDVMKVRGKVAVPFLQVWCKRRSPERAYAFGQLTAMGALWNAEDVAVGRNPSLVVATKARASWSAVDLSFTGWRAHRLG